MSGQNCVCDEKRRIGGRGPPRCTAHSVLDARAPAGHRAPPRVLGGFLFHYFYYFWLGNEKKKPATTNQYQKTRLGALVAGPVGPGAAPDRERGEKEGGGGRGDEAQPGRRERGEGKRANRDADPPNERTNYTILILDHSPSSYVLLGSFSFLSARSLSQALPRTSHYTTP